MTIFTSPAVIIMSALIIILDIAKEFADGILGKILAVVNICLHISLIFPLMLVKAPIAEAVLVYMCSTFVYTASHLLFSVVFGKEAKREEERGDI
ncbi:MAG: hypothetical protein J6C39_05745 [Clostridia bacterium]|nr:hypothetical protein [Clostridia bacterium]